MALGVAFGPSTAKGTTIVMGRVRYGSWACAVTTAVTTAPIIIGRMSPRVFIADLPNCRHRVFWIKYEGETSSDRSASRLANQRNRGFGGNSICRGHAMDHPPEVSRAEATARPACVSPTAFHAIVATAICRATFRPIQRCLFGRRDPPSVRP